MLREIVANGTLRVTGVCGIYSANARDDDVIMYVAPATAAAAVTCYCRCCCCSYALSEITISLSSFPPVGW